MALEELTHLFSLPAHCYLVVLFASAPFSNTSLTMSDDTNCGSGGGSTDYTGLRIASIFVIWVGSSAGALFPVLAKRTPWLGVPPALFEYEQHPFICEAYLTTLALTASQNTLDRV